MTCVWCESEDVERLADFGPGLMTEQWFCQRVPQSLRARPEAGPGRMRSGPYTIRVAV